MSNHWDDFVAAWKSVGLTMDEMTDAVNNWVMAIVEDIEGEDGIDESNGMTLDELIPETIAEWRQTKEEL